MRNQDIDSNLESLNQVLLTESKTIFKIPNFQREFVWGSNEANDMIDDFIEDTDNFEKDTGELQGYLMGNIVLINKESNLSLVVDGQQRLTTLSLLCKVLTNILSDKIEQTNNKDSELKLYTQMVNLRSGYHILNDEDEISSFRIVHEDNLLFGDSFKEIINSKDTSLSINKEPAYNSEKNIIEVYETLYSRVSEFSNNQLFKFVNFLKTKVKLIVTSTTSETKAFQLFEVLNKRGRTLEPMDLVKNTFLKEISLNDENITNHTEDTRNEFNSNWEAFIKNLQTIPNKTISSSAFMKHFISSEYGKNIKQSEIFEFFSKPNSKYEKRISNTLDTKEIIELSVKLKSYSKIYATIEKDSKSNDFLMNSKKMFILFNLLKIKQFHPILMAFYKESEADKEAIVDACIRYGVAVLYSFSQTNNIESFVPELINKLKSTDNDNSKINIAISLINEEIIKYKETINTVLPSKSFSKTKSITLLKIIELYFFNSNNSNILDKAAKGKSIELEHIMPTFPSNNLYSDHYANEEERKNYLNRIGNLTLLYKDENSSIGNKNFVDKIKMYKQSELFITKTIVSKIETPIKDGNYTKFINKINEFQPDYEVSKLWTKENIDSRGIAVKDIVLDIILYTNK